MVQQCLALPQGLPAHPGRLGNVHPAAQGSIKHPLRNFQGSATLLVVECAPQDCLAVPHERIMDHDQAAVPGVPRVTDFSQFGIMGVELCTCIITSAIIKARATCSSFLLSAKTLHMQARFDVANGLGAS